MMKKQAKEKIKISGCFGAPPLNYRRRFYYDMSEMR
jgi:hypothetical protein